MTQPPPPYGSPQEQPPGQPPYGGPPPVPQSYGAYGAAPAYGAYAPDHPQATLALILGIVGVVVCGLAAPFAWVIGGRAVREIDESQGRLGGRSNANAGRILGIIGTVLVALALLVAIGAFVIVLVSATASGT